MPNVLVIRGAVPSGITLRDYADMMPYMFPKATIEVETKTPDRVTLVMIQDTIGGMKVNVTQYITFIHSGLYIYSGGKSGWARMAPTFRESAQTISISQRTLPGTDLGAVSG
jgi:hypothetical protein